MNYIFLDVDGVLNSKKFFLEEDEFDTSIDLKNVNVLGEICRRCGAKVVLSSSWRRSLTEDLKPTEYVLSYYKKYKQWVGVTDPETLQTEIKIVYLLKVLERNGAKVVARTDLESRVGSNYWSRSEQIMRFVKKNLTNEDNYVILDDEDVVSLGPPEYREEMYPHFFQTDFDNGGLTSELGEKICKFFE